MSIFEEGSPFQGFLNKVTDLLILNLVTLLLCLPVITAGAALTAMHYVLLKMVRGEEGYIVKSFFRAFKREFRQATVMWVMFMALAALMASTLVMVLQGGGRILLSDLFSDLNLDVDMADEAATPSRCSRGSTTASFTRSLTL